jgi:hypothetical protein
VSEMCAGWSKMRGVTDHDSLTLVSTRDPAERRSRAGVPIFDRMHPAF